MKQTGGFLSLAALLAFLILVPLALAQEDLGLVVISPGEGEIVYASKLGYIVAIPVTGEVSTAAGTLADTAVSLTIRSPHAAPIALHTQADAQGFFRFNLDLNPDNIPLPSVGERFFDYAVHCPDCHFSSEAALPEGQVTLEITAVHPLAGRATAVRHITVDRSDRATLSVQVVLEDGAGFGLRHIPVQAETRLYEWRGRIARELTDAQGWAELDVEALSQRATHYLVSVPPTLIENRRYQSVEPVTVIIPADGGQAGPVTLRVRVENGIIDGQVQAPGAATTVLAVAQPSGRVHTQALGEGGRFRFDGLPLGRYLVVAQGGAGQGWTSQAAAIDLSEASRAEVTLAAAAAGVRRDGRVLDERGRPLPFGWLGTLGGNYVGQVSPLSGAFKLSVPDNGAKTLRVRVPGYWSQTVALDGAETVAITMQPRADLRRRRWGDGLIYMPAESVANESNDTLALVRGWLWGQNSDEEPFIVHLEGAQLTVAAGDFALEYAPGEVSYLYVNDGQATFTSREGIAHEIGGGQMMAFGDGVPNPEPIAADEQVIGLLREGRRPTVDLPTDPAPTFSQRVRQDAARLGQSVTQVTVGATYVLMLLAPLLALLLGIHRLVKERG